MAHQTEFQQVTLSFPDKVAVLLETNSNVMTLEKKKYLVPDGLSVQHFSNVVKKYIKGLSPEDELVFYCEGVDITNGHISKGSTPLTIVVSRVTLYKKILAKIGFNVF